jgi:hypothetical protein
MRKASKSEGPCSIEGMANKFLDLSAFLPDDTGPVVPLDPAGTPNSK